MLSKNGIDKYNKVKLSKYWSPSLGVKDPEVGIIIMSESSKTMSLQVVSIYRSVPTTVKHDGYLALNVSEKSLWGIITDWE